MLPAWVARPRLMPWCQQGLPHCGSPGGDGEALAGAVLRGWGTSLLLVPLQSCGCSCPSPVVKRQRDNSPRPRRCCRTSTHDGISRKLWGRAGKEGEGWHRQGRSRPFGSRGIWEVRSQDNLGSACGSTLELVQCRGCCGLEMMAVTRVARAAGGQWVTPLPAILGMSMLPTFLLG